MELSTIRRNNKTFRTFRKKQQEGEDQYFKQDIFSYQISKRSKDHPSRFSFLSFQFSLIIIIFLGFTFWMIISLMNNSNVNISSITMIPIISPNEHPQQDHHHSLSYHQNNHRKWDIPINYKCENIKYELQFCDSNGVCCSLSQTNLSSGCCLASHHVLQHSINIPQFENKSLELYNMNHERYSCLQCDEQSHCCLEYHSCVTCCLHPFHLELSHSLHIKESHYASFQLKDVSNFEWCSFICRPSSVSLSDSENSYRSPYNFCFLSNGPPQVFASVNSDRKHLTIKKNDESSRQQKTPRQSQYRYLRSFLLHDRKTSLGN